MAKKKRGDGHGGGHGWFVTFADLIGLMVSFFVMLVAFSNQDQQKLKIVAGSMREAFGVQTEARYAGIIESDGLPTRPKLKNVEHISPDESSNTPTPDEQERSRTAGARMKMDRECLMTGRAGWSRSWPVRSRRRRCGYRSPVTPPQATCRQKAIMEHSTS